VTNDHAISSPFYLPLRIALIAFNEENSTEIGIEGGGLSVKRIKTVQKS